MTRRSAKRDDCLSVPDRRWYDPQLDAFLHTGSEARRVASQVPAGTTIALDIETPGLDRAFDVNCVTAAWEQDGQTLSVLLDPSRVAADEHALGVLTCRGSRFVFHNAAFDVPTLWHHGWFRTAEIDRVVDTLVLARMAYPDPYDAATGRKDLSSLAVLLLGMSEYVGGMERAFRAAGHKTITAGYEAMDIDSPIYRQGAMADTVATLRLEPVLREKNRTMLTTHPFSTFGASTADEADQIIESQLIVTRVMLGRTARGLLVDTEYLAKYSDSVAQRRSRAEAELDAVGLIGGAGRASLLIDHLHRSGELPDGWPRTPKGKLQATKDLLDNLDHPLAEAQRTLAETDKVLGYLSKVSRQSEVTGRCHPQVGVLAASTTGRMSYRSPELQQFPADARPVIIADSSSGMTSIDWSQIEPVTMGLMAHDDDFLRPFEQGDDLYAPIQKAAGVSRSTAKVVLLATMYGQGVSGLARRINHSENQAAQIRRQMLSAMPACARWMSRVQTVADKYGMVITAGGRILPVDAGGVFKSVNYVVQGSAYDILADTICRMHRDGLGEHLQLALHDEVVVDTEVADEVRRIMEEPPDFLCKVSERNPKLRTDRTDMGPTWLKV